MLRVLVCGSRTWGRFTPIFNRLALLDEGTTIVHGAAPGADRLAASAAIVLGLTLDRPPTDDNPWGGYPADWNRYGKSAGFRRNREMIDSGVDLVIAFSRGDSPGTAHTIDLARRCSLPLEIHEWPS